MIRKEDIGCIKLCDLIDDYPFTVSFFEDNGIETGTAMNMTLKEIFDSYSVDETEDMVLDFDRVCENLAEFINQMLSFLSEDEKIHSITIHPGRDKSGNPEGFSDLKISRGEVISIVGPTGSGKSRLLGDIEWVAQADTPTGRRVMVNGEVPDAKWRFSTSTKLVAQLSQNMNFVMDLTVYEFIKLHAESRMVEDAENVITRIIEQGNELAGEKFTPETAITSLSGGQSRALMIADTAILSRSPIILIDEIENAGIDRKKALALLLTEEKIVLMATHDPILALMGDKRIVIKNGGIAGIIETTDEERSILVELEKLDRKILSYRTALRSGEILSEIK